MNEKVHGNEQGTPGVRVRKGLKRDKEREMEVGGKKGKGKEGGRTK